MRRPKYCLIIPGILAVAAIAVFFVLLVVKWLWAWTIPDLFPGAVEEGLIAANISWYTAFKLALFVGVLFGITGANRRSSD